MHLRNYFNSHSIQLQIQECISRKTDSGLIINFWCDFFSTACDLCIAWNHGADVWGTVAWHLRTSCCDYSHVGIIHEQVGKCT